MSSIGKNIKTFRKEKKLTQVELAKKANMSRSYLADVEGDRYNPSIETLTDIATALGVSVSSILGEEEETSIRYNDEERELTSELLNVLKNLTDDDSYFLEELLEELSELFADTISTGGEGEKFNTWLQRYLESNGDDRSESDDQYAIEEFNRLYDYRTVKDNILKYSSYSTKEYILKELINISKKYNIKPLDTPSKDVDKGQNDFKISEDILTKRIIVDGLEVHLTKEQREKLLKLTLAALDAVQ